MVVNTGISAKLTIKVPFNILCSWVRHGDVFIGGARIFFIYDEANTEIIIMSINYEINTSFLTLLVVQQNNLDDL